jgi:hypothetical protein
MPSRLTPVAHHEPQHRKAQIPCAAPNEATPLRTRWWLGAAGLVLVIGGGSTSLLRDALATQGHLTDAADDLALFAAAVGDGDPAAAAATSAAAAADVQLARTRVDGPLWTLAGYVPRYGATARLAREAVALVDATTVLTIAVAQNAAELIERGPGAFLVDGRIRTSELTELATTLDALPVDGLITARNAIAALPAAGLVGPIAIRRDEAVLTADDAIAAIAGLRDGLHAFATFLGGDGPREYLLAVQNPGELRGTGGLMSYFVELRVDDGIIELGDGIAVDGGLDEALTLTNGGGISSRSLVPVNRPDDFAARYDYNAGGALLQSVNLDPDLPTVGPVLLELYAARGGRPLDGVILVDPLALAEIVGVTGGPIPIPTELRPDDPTFPTSLSGANLAETLLITIYDAYGGLNQARRQLFDAYVTATALERLTGGAWEPVPLARALTDAARGRHLQLFSTVASEQATFVTLGIGGQVQPAADVTDVVGLVAVNAATNKADVHVTHRTSAAIELFELVDAAPGSIRRNASIEVAVDNPLTPGSHDTYIVGSTPDVPIGSGGPPRTDNALVRTWFSIWMPPQTQLTELTDGVNGRSLRYSNIHGHRAFDYFLETPSESTTSFSIEVAGDVVLRPFGREWVYELVLWRQGKAIPDLWELTLAPPPGWTVLDASIDGGGPATGMGPGAEGATPLAVTYDAASVQLDGAATRDATLRVVLRRP